MLRRVLPAVLVLGFCFALLEVGSCAFLRAVRGYDGEHLMSYQFDPYKNMRLTPHFRDTRGIEHNAQGFRRSSDTPRAKPEGTLRVFLMGGSTAYGIGGLSALGKREYPVIANDETIDYYLERALEGAIPGKRVEVINAAVTSFYSHHHLIYLNQSILKFDPDLVIFVDGFNDYFPYARGFDQFRDYAYQERAHGFMAEPTVSAWAAYTSWWLVRKSHFFHLAGHAGRTVWLLLNQGEGRPYVAVEQALANLRENAEANFVKMVERNGLILDHEGIPAVFTLQPELAFDQTKPFSPLEQQIFDEMENHWQENFVEYKRQARPIVIDYLEAATAATGSHFVDLTAIYGGVEGDVYTDYCHLTPLGNRVLAEALVPITADLLRERLASQRVDSPVAVGAGF